MELGFHAARTHWFQKIMVGTLAGALSFGLMAGIAPAQAHADDASDVQAQADDALNSLNDLLDQEEQAAHDFATASQNMNQAQSDIDVQNQRISDYQQELSKRARQMYRGGQSNYLSVLLGSTSFSEFANNWDLLGKLNQHDADLVSQTKDARQQLETDKQTYSDEKDALQQKQDELQQESQQMRDTYDSLSQEAKDLLAKNQQAQSALYATGGEAAQSAMQNSTNDQGQTETQAADAQSAQLDTQPQQTQNAGGDDSQQTYDGGGDSSATYSDSGSSSSSSSSYSGSGSVSGDPLGIAMSMVGGNYVLGAQDPASRTFDCSGLVCYACGIPRTDVAGIYAYVHPISESEAQPGDILLWGADTHAAIYAGGGMMVSADNPTAGINYEAIYPDGGMPGYYRLN